MEELLLRTAAKLLYRYCRPEDVDCAWIPWLVLLIVLVAAIVLWRNLIRRSGEEKVPPPTRDLRS